MSFSKKNHEHHLTIKGMVSKTRILLLIILCVSLSINAQINNTKPLKDVIKPQTVTPNFPKMDATIKGIINGAAGGTFKISMASLTLTKYKDTYSSYVGSTSFSTVSVSGKMTPLKKYDALSAGGAFFVNGSKRVAAEFKIYTTSLGGQKMSIRYTDGFHRGLTQIKNIYIVKKGRSRYIITGDSEKDGHITNYIFNIYSNEIQ